MAAVLALLCSWSVSAAGEETLAARVIDHYADLAQAMYGDSLDAAHGLQGSVEAMLAHPTPQTLAAARDAWRAARLPYLQTEGFRFGNQTVDAWEPRVNAWPMDEGLIDYVATSYGTHSDQNPLYALNVIAKDHVRIGARQIDARTIDEALLLQLQQAEGVQTNVATGYHAIEFLLWGQDLHGTGPGAGERPASDYDLSACTHGACARRAAYLRSATALLVRDLAEMTADWAPGGKARLELTAKGDAGGLAEILTGLGSLSYGEMAGERMKLGLLLHDPEEEQDCFSDNTHNAHYADELGIAELWTGRYVRSDGQVLDGPSIRSYALAADPAAAERVDHAIADATTRIDAIRRTAESGRMAYDQMIAAGNVEGNQMVQSAMEALVAQARGIEAVAAVLRLQVWTSRSDKTTGLH
jgi:putative iron-regulated protein